MKIDRLPRKILPVLFLMGMCFSVFADPASFQVISALSTTSSISRNTTGTKTVARTTGSLTTNNERDGRTMDTAVIVKATNDFAGTDEVYKWLSSHYPGYERINQATLGSDDDKRKFDKMTIRAKSGKQIDVWFDITSSFGKF